jgi:CHAD domain-containing protein
MGYALHHRTPIEADIGRIMREQIAKAADGLERVEDDPEQAIHECRKRCKKIRGAVRLVRPALTGGQYSTINGLARDAARELAHHRDAAAMARTFHRLVERWPASSARQEPMDRVGSVLNDRRRASADEIGAGHPSVVRARTLLAELDDAIDGIELEDTGFDAIGPGIAKAFGRGRDALDSAVAAPTGVRFHEWRKRAKYTRYHVDLLASSAPTVLEPLQRAFHDLTDALGDAHDLTVLGTWLRGSIDELAHVDTTDVRMVVDGTRSELQHRAVALGRRLYAETAKRFTERLETYWDVWYSEEGRSPAGDLERVFG